MQPLLNKLLLHFILSPNTLFSVSDLKQQVWQQEFLTDNAVKKAISELRQQLRSISDSNFEYIKNQTGKGYLLAAQPEILKDSVYRKTARYIGILGVSVLCALVLWLMPLSNVYKSNDDKTDEHRADGHRTDTGRLSLKAHTLYLQGKSLYYKAGDTLLVEQLFKQSIEADRSANPSHGALLDLWGLKLRSVKFNQRSDQLQSKVDIHIQALKHNPEYMTPDNLVSLAKYYLVNEGDQTKANALFTHNAILGDAILENATLENAILDNANNLPILSDVYDPHILAFTLALNGDKTQSQHIMAQAEQRFPERNVILWYKAFISLINNETKQATQEAQWAQRLAPDWYPLVFVASHILNADQTLNKHDELAWQHLVEFKLAFINRDLRQYKDFPDLLKNLHRIPSVADYQPFEVEILYFLGLYYDHALIQQTARQWIAQQFPEKQMMLAMIDPLFEDSVSE